MSFSPFSLPSDPSALSQSQLASLLDKLDDAYFNEHELVSDVVYDELLTVYTNRFGAREKVGAPIRNMANKRILLRPMPSLAKVKTETALDAWVVRNPGPYVITPKVDGISIQLHGRELSTRGTGVVGGIIDHLLPLLQMPKDAGTAFVRAECVMPSSVFREQYSDDFVNPRNMTGGLCNPASTSYKDEVVRDLRVLAYEFAIDEPMRQSEQLRELTRLGYEAVRHVLRDTITVPELRELLTQWRLEEDYEMDGLVITRDEPYPHPVDNSLPDHAIAFKMAGESVRTIAREVQWNTSKHGLLKPRVRIDPVVLDGVTITWATGHNAKFIVDNGIGEGAELEVERAGSVIPYIKKVLKPAPNGAHMPSIPYEWLKRKKMAPEGIKVPSDAVLQEVDGTLMYVWYVESDVDICTVGETPEQDIKVLAEFLKKMDAKHVGEATVTKLYQAGFQSLSSLLSLTVDDIVQVPGFQLLGATRIVQAIHGAISNVPLARLAGASGVFGAGFGERKISSVLAKIPDLLELDLPFSELCKLLNTAGLQTTAPHFAERLPAFKRWLREHPQVTVGVSVSSPAVPASMAVSQVSPVSQPSLSLKGEVIVLSGFRDKQLDEQIVARGGKTTSALSGKTTILVVKNLGTGNSKEQKASEMGIVVIDVDSFKEKYGL